MRRSFPAYVKILCCLLTALIFGSFLVPLSVSAAAPSLSAQAALLMDADSGAVLYERNAHTRLPMASTTKIMTALVVVECLDPSAMVCIDARAVGIEGSSIYLYEGEWLSVEQLLMGLLLESANDAAVALALAACDSVENFAAQMNQKAVELGLNDTHFENPHGLDAEEHYTTAYELGVIAAAALAHPVLRQIMATRRATIPLCDMNAPKDVTDAATSDAASEALPVGQRVLLNHNKMLRYYDGAIGVKTGYTKRSGRCLVSAACRDDLTLIAVTLNAPDDWNDHTQLLDYGFSRYERVTLCQEGEFRALLPISGGVEGYVMMTNLEEAVITLPRDHAKVDCRVELPHLTLAPVTKDTTHGRLVFLCDTDNDGKAEEIATLELYAKYDVPALDPPPLLSRIFAFLRRIFS